MLITVQMKKNRIFVMLFMVTVLFLLSVTFTNVYGQAERRFIREGNKLYEKEQFDESELSYRRAMEKNEESQKARFNLGNSLYKQQRYDESQKFFGELADEVEDPEIRSRVLHNLGNSLLGSGQIEQSIEAYKEALRNNPHDPDTRYNLAYALDLLEDREDQDQDDGDDRDQDDGDDQDQDQDDGDDQDQDQDQEDRDDQEPQPRPDQISPEDALRMLEAAEREEQRVQEKLMEEKSSEEKVRSGRNW